MTTHSKAAVAAFRRRNLRTDGQPFRLADGTVGYLVDLTHAPYPAIPAMRKVGGRWAEVRVNAADARAAIASSTMSTYRTIAAPATYAIVVTRQWYGPRTTKTRHMDPATGREWRGTRFEARAEIRRLERGDYECSHNESGRPSYSLVRDDSEPRH